MRDVGAEAGHLIRLAGELHDLGLDSVVRLPPHHEPSMEIPLADDTASGPAMARMRVTATRRRRTWIFTWGRGRRRRVPTAAPDAARRIAAAVHAVRAAHTAQRAVAAEAAQVTKAAKTLSGVGNTQMIYAAQAVPGVRVFWRAR
ncbi:hypothetical protein ACFHYQ_26235 [Sphaerimonospora cavernae]|uniref:HD domain-containing protein n=1 Tax=Sphaerimonospora cavernae TaxID=1740611 RepID=A0ABV6UCE3_9ACTN